MYNVLDVISNKHVSNLQRNYCFLFICLLCVLYDFVNPPGTKRYLS